MTQPRETSGLLGDTPGVDVPGAVAAYRVAIEASRAALGEARRAQEIERGIALDEVREAGVVSAGQLRTEHEEALRAIRDSARSMWSRIRARAGIESAFRGACSAHDERVRKAFDDVFGAFGEAMAPFDELDRLAHEAAYADLVEAVSGDPFAAYLTRPSGRARYDILTLLAQLPCAPGQLEYVAREEAMDAADWLGPEAVEAGVRPAPPWLGSESGLDFEALVIEFRGVQGRADSMFEVRRAIISARRAEALERGEHAEVAGGAYLRDLELAEAVRDATVRGALDALRDAVDPDPLAAWIMLHVSQDDQDEMLLVLGSFPCSPDYLDQMARDYGWCDQWDEYRSLAIAEGLVPGARS